MRRESKLSLLVGVDRAKEKDVPTNGLDNPARELTLPENGIASCYGRMFSSRRNRRYTRRSSNERGSRSEHYLVKILAQREHIVNSVQCQRRPVLTEIRGSVGRGVLEQLRRPSCCPMEQRNAVSCREEGQH